MLWAPRVAVARARSSICWRSASLRLVTSRKVAAAMIRDRMMNRAVAILSPTRLEIHRYNLFINGLLKPNLWQESRVRIPSPGRAHLVLSGNIMFYLL